MYLLSEMNILPVILLLGLWSVTGWLIVSTVFQKQVTPNERGLIGLGLGLVICTFIANLFARFFPPFIAFWGAGITGVIIGLVLSTPFLFSFKRNNQNNHVGLFFKQFFPKDSIQIASWIFFIFFTILFTLIGRGFGFFDDQQNLAPLSIMATGDIPPHFSYDPSLGFGFHYFLLLVGAQFVRIANAGPWTALDFARGITLALTITYGGYLAKRITNSVKAQAASMVFITFAGGARWLFFLLPGMLQRQVSSSVTLIGSAADSGANLISVMYKYWKIEGSGPLPFPFMLGSGIDQSISMFHKGFGTSGIMIALLLILLGNLSISERENGVTKLQNFLLSGRMITISILIASLALANEVFFAFLFSGFAFSAIIWVIQHRNIKLPRSFYLWIGVLAAAGIFSLFQGGMLTELAANWVLKFGSTAQTPTTYFKVSFAPSLPALLSTHLGALFVFNPLHWVLILSETGLAIFALPFVMKQLPDHVRDENWINAAWIGSIIFSLCSFFIIYTGNAGETAITRLQSFFLIITKIYAVPVLWIFYKNKSEKIHIYLFTWGILTVFSGISLFSIQLAAISNPVYAEYLDPLDAQMFYRQWDKLLPNTMVFDPVYPRAATILGRPIRSSKTMGETLPEWNAFTENPDPYQLKIAGYDYIYADGKYINKFSSIIQQKCSKMVDHITDKNGGKVVDERYLYQISNCLQP